MAPQAFDQYDIPERSGKLALFDASYLTDIPHYINEWHVSRIILVVSNSIYTKTGYVQKLEKALGDKVVGKQIGVGSHSPYKDVIAVTHLVQQKDADCLISIGGSSYSDACKIASKLAATLPGGFTAEDMEGLIDQSNGKGVTKYAKIKLILVPTTLSASEWNGIGSCTNSNGKKQHFGPHGLKQGGADVVLCDPELASTAPEQLWLSSGVRCIDHCVETICNRHCTERAEKDALVGLSNMIMGLIKYKESEGQDRAEFLRGISDAQKGSRDAVKALIVDGNSFGPSHAIGHQLGSVGHVMHGITSCIMLAPVLRYTAARSDQPVFSRAKIGQGKILKVFNDTLSWKETDAADALVRLLKQLGLPTRLSEVGVTSEKDIDAIAEKTLTDIWAGGEKQITDKQEVRKILDTAR
ncbi:hypothetical protein ANO11243_042740 [Dothideomycetidae sp. 11243]|nr:hypothetical protein ANO11243_042740 [fungal sp. No.11243]